MTRRGNPNIAEKGKATRFTSGSRAAECGHRGGVACARNREERQRFEAYADSVLKMPLDAGAIESVFGSDSLKDALKENVTVEAAALLNLARIAVNGGRPVAFKRVTRVRSPDGKETLTETEEPRSFISAGEAIAAIKLLIEIVGDEQTSDTSPLDALAAAIKERG